MSFPLFIAGLCFFFLPGFGMYDFLPDFIGAILIMRAIFKMTLLSQEMQEASKSFTKLCYISLFRLVSAFFLSFLFSSLGQQQSAGFETLLSIVFCGFELYFGFVAFRSLFAGLSYLQTRHGGSELPLSALSDLRTATYAFWIAKQVLNVLPTLDGLFGSQYNPDLDRNVRGIEYYTTLLQMFNLVLVSVFGIIWLVLMIRYFRQLRAQTAFLSVIDGQFEAEVARRPQFYLRRRLRAVCLLLGAACFFSVDFAIDRIFLLPDPFAAVLLLIVCILLYKEAFLQKKVVWFSAGALILSLGAELMLDYFNTEHALNAAYRGLQYHSSILSSYILSGLVQILWQAGALLVLYHLMQAFFSILATHTGHNGDKLSPREQEEDSLLRYGLKKRLWHVFILGCIYAVSSVAYVFLLPFFELYWLIQLAIGITFAVQAMASVTSLYDQVEYKYM